MGQWISCWWISGSPCRDRAMELVNPYLKSGAIVVCDNAEQYRCDYADYFEFLGTNRFRTMTLPFDGGLELSVRCRP